MTQYVTGQVIPVDSNKFDKSPHLKVEEKPLVQADILVLEDEPLVSALVNRYLSGIKNGDVAEIDLPSTAKIHTLPSGFELLRSDLSQIKVAVVDLLLPQITGVDLIRDFRKRFPNMGIIAVSGMATDSMKRSLLELLPKPLRFISKPLRKDEFNDAFNCAWNFYKESLKNSGQPQQASPTLTQEGEEELWTVVRTSDQKSPVIAVERRGLSRKKVAA